jgi:Ca2+-binding RTX toxin-like protein
MRMATITGTAASETLTGTANADIIYGLGGNDVLNGGAGTDTLIGGAGADVLNGGASIDRVIYTDSSAAIQITEAGAGTGTGGDAEGDTFDNIEIYYGSNYDDTFTMGLNNRTVYGGLGNDTYIFTYTGISALESAGEVRMSFIRRSILPYPTTLRH